MSFSDKINTQPSNDVYQNHTHSTQNQKSLCDEATQLAERLDNLEALVYTFKLKN